MTKALVVLRDINIFSMRNFTISILLSVLISSSIYGQNDLSSQIDFEKLQLLNESNFTGPVLVGDSIICFNRFGKLSFSVNLKNFSEPNSFNYDNTFFEGLDLREYSDSPDQVFLANDGSIWFAGYQITSDTIINYSEQIFNNSLDVKYFQVDENTIWAYQRGRSSIYSFDGVNWSPVELVDSIRNSLQLIDVEKNSQGNIYLLDKFTGIWRFGNDTIIFNDDSISDRAFNTATDLFIDSNDNIWFSEEQENSNVASIRVLINSDWITYDVTEDINGIYGLNPFSIYERPNGEIVILDALGINSVFNGSIWTSETNFSPGPKGVVFDMEGTEFVLGSVPGRVDVSIVENGEFSFGRANRLGGENLSNSYNLVVFNKDSLFHYFENVTYSTNLSLKDSSIINPGNITLLPGEFSGNVEKAVTDPTDSTIYLLGRDGSFYFINKGGAIQKTNFKNTPAFGANNFTIDNSGKIWISNADPRFSPTSEGVQVLVDSIWTDVSLSDGIGSLVVYDLTRGKDGKIYAAHEQGYSVYDGDAWSSVNIPESFPVGLITNIDATLDGRVYFTGFQSYLWYTNDGVSFNQLNFNNGALTNNYENIKINPDGILFALASGKLQVLTEDQLFTLEFDHDITDFAFGLNYLAIAAPGEGILIYKINGFRPLEIVFEKTVNALDEVIDQPGKFLGEVIALDVIDGNLNVQVEGNDKFAVINDTLRLVAPLDFETNEVENFSLVATNSNGYQISREISYNILDFNERPVLMLTDTLESFNYITADSVVGIVGTATDPEGEQITYRIANADIDKPFKIDALTGELKINNYSQISRDTSISYTLGIFALDPFLNSAQDSLVIVLKDNLPPELINTSFTVEENSEVNTVIGSVRYEDLDSDIIRFASVDSNSVFELTNSGDIILISDTLNFEDTNSYSIPFIVTDTIDSVSSTLQIEILDINEPVFAINSIDTAFVINLIGFIIGSVEATDEDGDELTYTIQGNGDFFEVSNEGVIQYSSIAPGIGQYEFNVISSDGEFSATTSVRVELTTVVSLNSINLSFYPNPVRTEMFVESESGYYAVHDLSGKLIINGIFINNSIDLNNLEKGNYQIIIVDNFKNIQTARFIKN